MRRARIATLHAAAKQRGAGYLEACFKAGKISADGQWIIFDDQAHAKIRQQFTLHLREGRAPRSRHYYPIRESQAPRNLSSATSLVAGGSSAASPRTGLGDIIHKIAGPIGRAIHWPCMKGDGSTDLKPGSPCAKARNLANKVQI